MPGMYMEGHFEVASVIGTILQVPTEVVFPTLDYDRHKILTAPTAILDGVSARSSQLAMLKLRYVSCL